MCSTSNKQITLKRDMRIIREHLSSLPKTIALMIIVIKYNVNNFPNKYLIESNIDNIKFVRIFILTTQSFVIE